jgi:signal transduction histidine kinase
VAAPAAAFTVLIDFVEMMLSCGIAGRRTGVELETALEPVPEAPARARVQASRLADSLPATTYQDLRVVITELVTNAVKHGPGEAIWLWLSVSGPTVRGEVADGGTGNATIDRAHSREGTGLGLQIVDALCSSWHNPTGTGRVRFQLRLADVDLPGP